MYVLIEVSLFIDVFRWKLAFTVAQRFSALRSRYLLLKGACCVTQRVVTPQQNVAIPIGQSM